MGDEFSTDAILKTIHVAIIARDFHAVPGLLAMLAVRDLEATRRIYDAIQGKITLDFASAAGSDREGR